MAACARLPISMIGLGLVNGNERFSSDVRNWAKADIRSRRIHPPPLTRAALDVDALLGC